MLLGFHAALEGISLAFEPTASALRAGFVPLLVHKFFDGLLLGIQAARSAPGPVEPRSGRKGARGEDPMESPETPVTAGSGKSALSRGFLGFVLLWSVVTPAALLAAIASGQTSSGKSGASSGPGMGPGLQSLGAGTFLYVAMMEVLASEFRTAASAPRSRGSRGATATGWSASVKLAVVIAGCCMVRLIEGGNHHHHH